MSVSEVETPTSLWPNFVSISIGPFPTPFWSSWALVFISLFMSGYDLIRFFSWCAVVFRIIWLIATIWCRSWNLFAIRDISLDCSLNFVCSCDFTVLSGRHRVGLIAKVSSQLIPLFLSNKNRITNLNWTLFGMPSFVRILLVVGLSLFIPFFRFTMSSDHTFL